MAGGQGGEDHGDVGERDAEPFRDEDQRDAADHVPAVEALLPGAALGDDQTLALVEAQGRGGHAGAGDDLTHAEGVRRACLVRHSRTLLPLPELSSRAARAYVTSDTPSGPPDKALNSANSLPETARTAA
jgi:hypothetical protein